MTRILIVGVNYAPEPTGIAPYTTATAEHLAARGYRVTVLTGMPHYPAWERDSAYCGRFAIEEHRAGVRIERRWHHVPRRQSALRRGLFEATFTLGGLSGMALPRPHAVVGIMPNVGAGVLARTLAVRFGVPYGVVFQDLAGRAAAASGMPGGRAVGGLVGAAEGWAARGAAAVGIVAEGFRPHVERMGVEPGRVRRLRNWTHTGEATVSRREMRLRLGIPQDATLCLHAGNMGLKQGLEAVIDAAAQAQTEAPDVIFALVGDGSQRSTLERQASERGVRNVRFLPLQPEGVFPSALACADILLLHQRASVDDMALPSKLTSYAASGRPVIAAAAPGSEAAREVRASGGGIVVAPEDPQALLAAVRRLSGDAALAAHIGAQGRAWAAGELSAESALRAYEQFVATLLAPAPRGRVHQPGRRLRSVTPVAAVRQTDDDERRAA